MKIHADGIRPDPEHIAKMIEKNNIAGFTANPSLLKAFLPIGYYEYAKTIIDNSQGFPVSIQVLSSDIHEMHEQARKIASWGENVYVKIPIMNEYGHGCERLIVNLLDEGIKINATAIFTEEQVYNLMEAGLRKSHDCILSIFCGRIADTGLLPQDTVRRIANLIDFNGRGNLKLLWAGVRSITDIHYAREKCDVITIPQPILDKLPMAGKDLNEYTIETVKMFARDAANFTI